MKHELFNLLYSFPPITHYGALFGRRLRETPSCPQLAQRGKLCFECGCVSAAEKLRLVESGD